MDRALDAYSRPYSSIAPSPNPSAYTYDSTASYATASSYSHSRSNSRPAQSYNATGSARANAKAKLVVVGDGGVGKTCLLCVYSEQRFPTEYIPTVFETSVSKVPFGADKLVEFSLWDTAGQEEYDRLRPLSYPDTNVLLVCFSCDYPTSLENIQDKWYPEIAHFCEGVPLFLVATKTDLRLDSQTISLLRAQGRTPVTRQEGESVARRIGAIYFEVSAAKGVGVQELFDAALKEAMGMQEIGSGTGKGGVGSGKMGKKRSRRCKLL